MKRILLILSLFCLTACTEKMIIDIQEGNRMIGVSASITDEYKKHEVILSYTESFYGGAPTMISGADVSVLDGILDTIFVQQDTILDTIWLNTIAFYESDELGHYLSSNEFAGETNHVYRLLIDIQNSGETKHYYSESKMNINVDKIDSIKVKPWVFGDLEMKNYLGVYPYFKTTKDPKTYYMARIRINDNIVGGDTLTKCELFEMYQFAGLYFNDPVVWIPSIGEMPIYGLNQRDSLEVVHHGDTVTLDIWSIPGDYAHYIFEIASSTGTNPMMGTPSNVRTNIYPKGTAVGMFHASSLRQCSVIY